MTIATKEMTALRRWARGFSGVLDMPAYMASPPTISGTQQSTTTLGGSSVLVPFTDSRLSYGLDAATADTADATRSYIYNITLIDGTKFETANKRVRFMTDAAQFEFVSGFSQFPQIGALIDGQLLKRDPAIVLPTTAGNRYTKFDFGANVLSYELRHYGNALTSGGSGYFVGDQVTLAGGTTSDPAVVQITGASGSPGAATSVAVVHPGSYSAVPANPLTQASTTGTGTGLQITTPVWGSRNTTTKMRRIEIGFTPDCRFKGIQIPQYATLVPWPVPGYLPRTLIVGDSQTRGTYRLAPFDSMGYQIARRLGLEHSYSVQAIGGTGWNTPSGNSPSFSHANRVADYIAARPDIIIFLGSQNDSGQTTALQAAVTNTLNTLLAALPNVVIIGIGSVIGGSTIVWTKAGFLGANDQLRCQFIDNTNWVSAGGGSSTHEAGVGNRDWTVSSDSQHFAGDGMDWFTYMAAVQIANALIAAAA